MAATWEGHWDWWFDGGRREEGSAEPCSVCSGPTLSLADGLHCLDCSSYRAWSFPRARSSREASGVAP
jgi:hypothetical protein